MARIRTIKPEFWQDEDLAMLEAETRLLAIGLLNHADDEGYFKAHPALVKAVVFPFTEDSLNIHGMLKQLEKVSYLTLFEGVDGKHYGKINRFKKHQKVNRPSPSKIRGFEPVTEDSLNNHGDLTAGKEQGTGNREHVLPKKKKAPIPKDFKITEQMAEWFSKQGFTIDMLAATSDWQDNMLKDEIKYQYTDWTAAWRNGMKNAQKWSSERPNANSSPRTPKAMPKAGSEQ